jgi:hypothetical protein
MSSKTARSAGCRWIAKTLMGLERLLLLKPAITDAVAVRLSSGIARTGERDYIQHQFDGAQS